MSEFWQDESHADFFDGLDELTAGRTVFVVLPSNTRQLMAYQTPIIRTAAAIYGIHHHLDEAQLGELQVPVTRCGVIAWVDGSP